MLEAALDKLSDLIERVCPEDTVNMRPDTLKIPQNNIYTHLNNADEIDMDKIEQILHYLDLLLLSWYPQTNKGSKGQNQCEDENNSNNNNNKQQAILNQQQQQSPLNTIALNDISFESRPHLHQPLDLINTIPIDNNLNKKKNEKGDKSDGLDTLTRFHECENIDISSSSQYLRNLPPLPPNSDYELSPTIPFGEDVTSSGLYSLLQSHFTTIFLSNGIRIPFIPSPFTPPHSQSNTTTTTNSSQLSPSNSNNSSNGGVCRMLKNGCMTFLHILSLLPIFLVSLLILTNLKFVLLDWWLPGFQSWYSITSFDAQLRDVGIELLPPRVPIEAYGASHFEPHLFPLFLHSIPILTHILMFLGTLYALSIIISGLLTLYTFIKCHATSNSLDLHKPTQHYFTELQRRTVYTYYCLLNHIFPPTSLSTNTIPSSSTTLTTITSHPAPLRRDYLITPLPNILPTSLTMNGRLRQMILCDPTRFVSLSRCRHCDLNIFRPPGAHHCGACGTCSAGFDHHCVFLANDVGTWNHKLFINFLFWASVGCSLFAPIGIYLTIFKVGGLFGDRQDDMLFTKPGVYLHLLGLFFCSLMTVSFAVVLAAFCYFHLNLIMNEETTFDNIMAKRGVNSNKNDNKNNLSSLQLDQFDDDDDSDGNGENIKKTTRNQHNDDKPLWEQRLSRVLGPSRLYWFIPIDTIYLHRDGGKNNNRLKHIPLGPYEYLMGNNGNIRHTSLNAQDDDDESDDDNSQTTSSRYTAVYSQEDLLSTTTSSSTPPGITSTNVSNSDGQTFTLPIVDRNDHLFFTEKLFTEDDYYFPYQFTHHLFPNLHLLSPERYESIDTMQYNLDSGITPMELKKHKMDQFLMGNNQYSSYSRFEQFANIIPHINDTFLGKISNNISIVNDTNSLTPPHLTPSQSNNTNSSNNNSNNQEQSSQQQSNITTIPTPSKPRTLLQAPPSSVIGNHHNGIGSMNLLEDDDDDISILPISLRTITTTSTSTIPPPQSQSPSSKALGSHQNTNTGFLIDDLDHELLGFEGFSSLEDQGGDEALSIMSFMDNIESDIDDF